MAAVRTEDAVATVPGKSTAFTSTPATEMRALTSATLRYPSGDRLRKTMDRTPATGTNPTPATPAQRAWYRPAAHAVQAEVPVLSMLYDPAEQVVHTEGVEAAVTSL